MQCNSLVPLPNLLLILLLLILFLLNFIKSPLHHRNKIIKVFIKVCLLSIKFLIHLTLLSRQQQDPSLQVSHHHLIDLQIVVNCQLNRGLPSHPQCVLILLILCLGLQLFLSESELLLQVTKLGVDLPVDFLTSLIEHISYDIFLNYSP